MKFSTKLLLARDIFPENIKGWIKVIFYAAWLILPNAYFWSHSTVCTVGNMELGAELRLAQSEKSFSVSTLYKYTHRSQPYAVEIANTFSSQQKGKQWIAKHPVGSEAQCLVSFSNPAKITVLPLGFPFIWKMLDFMFYPACGFLLLMVFGLMKMYFPFGFTFDPQIRYEKISHDFEERIRTRYQEEFIQLQDQSFKKYCNFCEVLPNYSVIWSFFEYLEMRWRGEITQIQDSLRLTLLQPLLVLPEEATYASIYAKGVSFYTRMSNGTGIITRTDKITVFRQFYDQKRKLHVHSTEESVVSTWEFHREQVEELQKEGFSVRKEKSFEDFSDMAEKLDESFWEENRWMG